MRGEIMRTLAEMIAEHHRQDQEYRENTIKKVYTQDTNGIEQDDVDNSQTTDN